MIQRYYKISEYVQPGKVLVIYGPRRVGKTTLIQEYIKQTKLKYRLESGENIDIQNLLGSNSFEQLDEWVA